MIWSALDWVSDLAHVTFRGLMTSSESHLHEHAIWTCRGAASRIPRSLIFALQQDAASLRGLYVVCATTDQSKRVSRTLSLTVKSLSRSRSDRETYPLDWLHLPPIMMCKLRTQKRSPYRNKHHMYHVWIHVWTTLYAYMWASAQSVRQTRGSLGSLCEYLGAFGA